MLPERLPDDDRCLLLEFPRELRDHTYRWVPVLSTGLCLHEAYENLILSICGQSSEGHGLFRMPLFFALCQTCKQRYSQTLVQQVCKQCEHVVFTDRCTGSVRDPMDIPLRTLRSPHPHNVPAVAQRRAVLDKSSNLFVHSTCGRSARVRHIEIIETGVTRRGAMSSEEMVKLATALRLHSRRSTVKMTVAFWPRILRDWQIMNPLCQSDVLHFANRLLVSCASRLCFKHDSQKPCAGQSLSSWPSTCGLQSAFLWS